MTTCDHAQKLGTTNTKRKHQRRCEKHSDGNMWTSMEQISICGEKPCIRFRVQFIETHTWTSAIVYILLEVDFSRKFEVNFRCEIELLHLIRRVSNIIRLGESNLAWKMLIFYKNSVASMKK
jgi:hypothetical protein